MLPSLIILHIVCSVLLSLIFRICLNLHNSQSYNRNFWSLCWMLIIVRSEATAGWEQRADKRVISWERETPYTGSSLRKNAQARYVFCLKIVFSVHFSDSQVCVCVLIFSFHFHCICIVSQMWNGEKVFNVFWMNMGLHFSVYMFW